MTNLQWNNALFAACSLLLICLSAVLTRAFYAMAQNTRLMDIPNARSMHAHPVVRGGGLVFIAVPLLTLPLLCHLTKTALHDQLLLVTTVLLLSLINFMDDLYTLSVKTRFPVQVVVALLLSLLLRPALLDFGVFTMTNPYAVAAFLFLAIVWSINHFNFMDGLDGFCVLQSIFLFFSYLLLFTLSHAVFYQGLCLVFICCLVGFLLFNFPPAKIFMGDVGSATLGLIVFYLAIVGQREYDIPLVYWFMLNSLFLFDSVITLFRRVCNKENFFAAHKKHAYQRVKQLGVNTRLILLGQTLINCIFLCLLVLVHTHKIPLLLVFCLQLTGIAGIYYAVEKKNPFV